ncbi:MAG: ABC transporter substrate-binding protein [Anaerolineales bacterium]|nr:ABC transporter substrate-binding protein [Anaerolineales bacterium]
MKSFKYLSMLLVLMLLLTACGQAKETASPVAAPPDTTTVEVPAGTETSADKSQLQVAYSWPVYIDPAVGSDEASSSALVNMYDTLIFPTSDGNVIPWLAESWETSDDGLTLIFHLRQGVQFHDGSELQASDVVYSFNRLKTIGEGYGYLYTSVASATTVDDYTVEFIQNEASGLFLPSLVRLFILNEDLVRANTAAEGAYGEAGDYGKTWLLINDAGSGPYQVTEFQLEEYLLMEKYTGWWGEFVENAPDQVRFVATTEAATIRTLMSSGEIDISDAWQSIESLENLDELDGVSIAALPTFSEFYFMMNTRIPPTDDINCRRAMAYAFDYDTAISLEWPGTQQSKGPVPAALGGHNPDVFVFSRDLAKAAEELAQCQYADSIAVYPVQIHWVSEVPDEEKFALLFQANMAEIGIPVEVFSTPWLSVVENTGAQETSPHIVTIYVSADLPEAGPMLKQRYHSSSAATWSQNEWLLDETLDAAIDDALSTIDTTERFAKYAELQSQLVDLSPSLFVYDQVQKNAYQDYIDWPAVRGETSALLGYFYFAPEISINK